MPKTAVKGSIDAVAHGIWPFEGRREPGPREWKSTSLRGGEYPTTRCL